MPLYHHKIKTNITSNFIHSNLTMPTSGKVYDNDLTDSSNWNISESGASVIFDNLLNKNVFNITERNGFFTISTFEGLPFGTSDRTMSFWSRKMDSVSEGWAGIGYGSGYDTGVRFTWGIYQNYSAFTAWADDYFQTNYGNISDDNWHHYLLTLENDYTVKLYVDGTLTFTTDHYSINTQEGYIHIGDYYENYYAPIARFSNFKIYNRVLNENEIITLSQQFIHKQYYINEGFDEFGHSIEYNSAEDANCNNVNWVDDNTILYIPMYGNNPFEDKSRNSYQVTNYNVTAITDEHPAKSKGAGYFSANGQYLYINSNILSGLTTFTLDFDYKLTALPSGGDEWQQGYYFAANGENYADPGCDMYFATSQIVISFDYYSYRVNIPYTPDTNWHKLKITRNASNLVSVYQDNNLLKSYTESRSFYTGNYGFAIGRVEPQGEESGAGFHGYIANYRISNIDRK